MPLPAFLIPFWPAIVAIFSTIASFLYRRVVIEVLLLIVAAGVSLFRDELRQFFDGLLASLNQKAGAVVDLIEDQILARGDAYSLLVRENLESMRLLMIDDVNAFDVQALIASSGVTTRINELITQTADAADSLITGKLDALLTPIESSMALIPNQIAAVKQSTEALFDTLITDRLDPVSNYLASLASAETTISNVQSGITSLPAQIHAELNAAWDARIEAMKQEGAIIPKEIDQTAPALLLPNVRPLASQLAAPLATIRQRSALDLSVQPLDLPQLTEIQNTVQGKVNEVSGVVASVRAFINADFAANAATLINTKIGEVSSGLIDQVKTESVAQIAERSASVLETLQTEYDGIRAQVQGVIDGAREQITDEQSGVFSAIADDDIDGMFNRVMEGAENEQRENLQQNADNIKISEFIDTDGLDPDRVTVPFPDLEHGDGPIRFDGELWTIQDIYRIAVNYQTREERIALAFQIADKDLLFDYDLLKDEIRKKQEADK